MPESRIIPSQTTINIVGSAITVLTQYFNEAINGGTINAFVMEVIGGQTVDGVSFIEGEGGISIGEDLASPPVFSFNSNGELIVTDPLSSQFSVDGLTGQLQFTT